MCDTLAENDPTNVAADWFKARDSYAISYGVSAIQAEYWRVAFSRAGKRRQKTFYFQKLGGREAAYAAAIAWRDAELHQKPAMTIKAFATLRRSHNTSGVPGVTLQYSKRQPKGFWQAGLTLKDGTRWRRNFPIHSFGYDVAYVQAVKARQEMVRAAKDRPFVHNPYARVVAQAQAQAQAQIETRADVSGSPPREVYGPTNTTKPSDHEAPQNSSKES